MSMPPRWNRSSRICSTTFLSTRPPVARSIFPHAVERELLVEVADEDPASRRERRSVSLKSSSQRAQGPGRRGIGLGLAICRGIVEAHRRTDRLRPIVLAAVQHSHSQCPLLISRRWTGTHDRAEHRFFHQIHGRSEADHSRRSMITSRLEKFLRVTLPGELQCNRAITGESGLRPRCRNDQPDLIILDLGLPVIDDVRVRNPSASVFYSNHRDLCSRQGAR